MLIIGIPSSNRVNALELLIPELLKSKLDNLDFKILIINTSSSNYSEINKRYQNLSTAFNKVEVMHVEGGPSAGRKAVSLRVKNTDTIIMLDDDTFPENENTLLEMYKYFNQTNLEIISGIWECEKNPSRPYGEIIIEKSGVITRKTIRMNVITNIHIPLATFICNGKTLKDLDFDPQIRFYGDMLDMGLCILRKGIKCSYNPDFLFFHKKIENLVQDTSYRQYNQWQYLADKWGIGFFKGSYFYSPKNQISKTTKEYKRKIFIVELNAYHHETIPGWIKLLDESIIIEVCILLNSKIKDLSEFNNVTLNEFDNPNAILEHLAGNASVNDACILNSSGRLGNIKNNQFSAFTYTTEHLESITNLNIFNAEKLLVLHHDLTPNAVREKFPHKAFCLQPRMAKIHNYNFITLQSNELMPISQTKEGATKNLIVAGLVEKKRRDYFTIVSSFANHSLSEKGSLLRLNIVGGVPYKEQNYFKEIIEVSNKISGNINIELPKIQGSKIPETEFNSQLLKADFIVFGINPDLADHTTYLFTKGSGSLNLALSYGLIPIAEKRIARAYSISRISITYDNFSDALTFISKMSRKDINDLKVSVQEYAKDLRKKSKDLLSKMLE